MPLHEVHAGRHVVIRRQRVRPRSEAATDQAHHARAVFLPVVVFLVVHADHLQVEVILPLADAAVAK